MLLLGFVNFSNLWKLWFEDGLFGCPEMFMLGILVQVLQSWFFTLEPAGERWVYLVGIVMGNFLGY